VDIEGILRSFNPFDLLVVLGLMAMFILGFIQGTVRRLLGLASIVFSLLLAAQLREPLGDFLASNWTQFPDQYSRMIGFGAVFVAASITFTIAIQAFYRVVPLFVRFPVVDELLGGVLGVLQGAVILGAAILILDPFYQLSGIPAFGDEMAVLRTFHEALDNSTTAIVYREQIIPGFFAVAGGLFPEAVRAVFPAS